MEKLDLSKKCRQCPKLEIYKTLKSSKNDKTIQLCEKCYKKRSKGLINGHGYYEINI